MEEAMIEMAKQLPAGFALIVMVWMFQKERKQESINHREAAEHRRAIAEKQETARLEQENARLEMLTTIINENTKVMGSIQELLRKD